jgi:N-carbamoylputrescine amidase
VEEIEVIAANEPPESPARTRPPEREPFRIAALQHRWHEDPAEHRAALEKGIGLASEQGARLVCLQELTLSRYFAVDEAGPQAAGAEPEDLPGGPTFEFAAAAAAAHGIHVHASLYERADSDDGLGFNTAILVSPEGELIARTRKLHIPVTAGYYEDRYFRPGPTGDDANGVFMVAVNRIGDEGELTFYGSSFISDPYGRVLAQAPRDKPAVLVADLDLDQRRDWLELFPLIATRRPDAYKGLTER